MDKKSNMTIIEKLVKLGFNETEAKVYVELLKTKGLNGTQLSKALNLPRSSVYTALEILSNKGYIYLIPSNKDLKNYNPLYPEDLVKKMKKEYMYILESIGLDLDKIYTPSKYELVYNIEGRDNIIYKLEDMLGSANNKRVVSGYLDERILEKYTLTEHINKYEMEKLICITDDSNLLIANINGVYATAIFTKNTLIISQTLKGLE